jgi:uncharacterized lipoprotein
MTMLKRFFFPVLALFMLAGCATTTNTLNITPKISLPTQDPTVMGVTISVNSTDQRQTQTLASVNRDGQLINLTPSRDIRYLLQEALEKQMTARGYMVGSSGGADLQIVINNLYADVQEGNLRYNITTKADIAIMATARNGSKQVKNYRATYNVQGAFNANNETIAKAINTALGDVISDMAQDTTVSDFVKANSRH